MYMLGTCKLVAGFISSPLFFSHQPALECEREAPDAERERWIDGVARDLNQRCQNPLEITCTKSTAFHTLPRLLLLQRYREEEGGMILGG